MRKVCSPFIVGSAGRDAALSSIDSSGADVCPVMDEQGFRRTNDGGWELLRIAGGQRFQSRIAHVTLENDHTRGA